MPVAQCCAIPEDVMDILNKNLLWPLEDVPAFAKELSGVFVTTLEGVPCVLTLVCNQRSLGGLLSLDEQVFNIKGFFSSLRIAAYGLLLEPISHTPVALLKITPRSQGVILELDIPDIDAVILTKPRALNFYRKSAEVI